MKAFYFDVETTGVQYWRNSIHQLAGAVVIDGVVAEYFDFKIRPHELAVIEDSALEAGGVTREQIALYPHRTEVHTRFLQMLARYVDKYDKTDKFFLLGYNNAGFDDKFLRMFFELENDNYFGSWFWSHPIDVMVLASQYLAKERPLMLDFKQSTVAEYLGIAVDRSRLHEAAYDVYLLMQIYAKVARPPAETWEL